jgi:hypothetical protein
MMIIIIIIITIIIIIITIINKKENIFQMFREAKRVSTTKTNWHAPFDR